jgi:photosystem II stability/assembly factor-like uncharacterized protein
MRHQGTPFSVCILLLISTELAFAQEVWTEISPHPTSNPLKSVTWTGSQFVAVGGVNQLGDTCRILTSPNGTNWTSIDFGVNEILNFVTWVGGLLVAVGNSGTIVTSPDGTAWTRQNSGTVDPLFSVVWTGDWLVAAGSINKIGDTSKVLLSHDGITWTSRNIGINEGFFSITWTGTQLVAAGQAIPDTGRIFSSSDGMTWTASSQAAGLHRYLQSITWTGNQFVAVGFFSYPLPYGLYGSYVLTSPDGQVWTQSSTYDVADYGLNSVTWSGNQLVAVGSSGTIISSSDGKNWIRRTSGISADLNSVIGTGSLLVAVASDGTILTSPISTTVLRSRQIQMNRRGFDLSTHSVAYFLPYASLVSIRLFDLRGKLLKILCECVQSAGSHATAIPSGLTKGNYILSFINERTRISRNIIIEK